MCTGGDTKKLKMSKWVVMQTGTLVRKEKVLEYHFNFIKVLNMKKFTQNDSGLKTGNKLYTTLENS